MERKRSRFLVRMVGCWFDSHLDGFRSGGSGYTFDGMGFYLLLFEFPILLCFCLRFRVRLGLGLIELKRMFSIYQ